MKFIKKISLVLLLLVVISISSFSVQQPVFVAWTGEHSYTVTFYTSGYGYNSYEINSARSDEELQCYAYECWVDHMLKVQAWQNR